MKETEKKWMPEVGIKRKRNFTIAPNELIDSGVLTVSEKMVYIVLCRHANKELNAFPSYETIAKRAGMSRRTTIRAMNKLEEVGLVVKKERRRNDGGQTSNLYILTDEINVEN